MFFDKILMLLWLFDNKFLTLTSYARLFYYYYYEYYSLVSQLINDFSYNNIRNLL